MNAITFGSKRAYHESQVWARKKLRPFGITPARYDMLKVIGPKRRWFCVCWQRRLREVLGVSHEVISRMLRAMVKDGLVRRELFGKRKYIVTLTRLGRRLFHLLRRHVLRPANREVAQMFDWEHHELTAMCACHEWLLMIQRKFNKDFHMAYPPPRHPDD